MEMSEKTITQPKLLANGHGEVSNLSQLFRDNTILFANEPQDFTTLIFLFFAHLQIKY